MLKNHRCQKINSKMLLHKKGKNWIVLSIGILSIVLGGFSLKENNVHANINQPQQQVQTRTVSSQANNLHKNLVNNATKQQLNHNHNLSQRPIKQDQSNQTMKLGASQSSILANNARNQYNYLKQYENSDNQVYLSKPYFDDDGNQISDGKINPTYTQHIIDWMNYVRGLYNIPPVSHNTNLDKIAQSDAVNQYSDDSYIYPSDTSYGVPTTSDGEYQKNSYYNSDKSSKDTYYTPSDVVMIQFNNNNRLWLLDPDVTTVGVGYYEGNIQFIYNKTPTPNKNESYATPAVNLSPYKISNKLTMKNTLWSVTLPNSIVKDSSDFDFSGATIYDDTAHKKVPLKAISSSDPLHTIINSDGEALYNSFEVRPNGAYIKPNHVYTITWHCNYPKGIIKYRTKLYSTYSYKTSRVHKHRTRRHRTRVVKNKRHHVHNNRRHRRTRRIRTHRHHRRSTKRHTHRNRKNRHRFKRNARHHRHHRRH